VSAITASAIPAPEGPPGPDRGRRHSAAHLSPLQLLIFSTTAAALRHVTGFPGIGLLRRLRPVPDRSAVGAPSPPTTLAAREAGKIRTVPVFAVIRSLKEEPDCVPAASP
jgi:hypothetical protein